MRYIRIGFFQTSYFIYSRMADNAGDEGPEGASSASADEQREKCKAMALGKKFDSCCIDLEPKASLHDPECNIDSLPLYEATVGETQDAQRKD